MLFVVRAADAFDLTTATNWIREIEKKSDAECLTFIKDHQQDWPVLRSPSWIERQVADVRLLHKDDRALALLVLAKLHSITAANFAGHEGGKAALASQLLSIADNCKTKGGHNNDVLALAYERVAIHLALAQVKTKPSDAVQFAGIFVTDSKKHVKTKEWLRARGDEDAWLHDKMERIETITDTDEQSPFGVLFRLAQGAEAPATTPFSFRSLIENSNVVRLLFEAVNAEYSRTVAIPLVVDYVVAGGVVDPRPTNPIEAVREKLGIDMSKYYHRALRQGDASANDVWNALNQLTNEPSVRATLVRWLE